MYEGFARFETTIGGQPFWSRMDWSWMPTSKQLSNYLVAGKEENLGWFEESYHRLLGGNCIEPENHSKMLTT